jgi:hypothetical protein
VPLPERRAPFVRAALGDSRAGSGSATPGLADRVALYRRLCSEAGIRQGFSHYGGAIEFLVNTRGLAISGSSKGFVHRVGPDPDAIIVDADLDIAAVALAKQRDVLLQRRIEGDWWLQLDRR